MRPPSSGVPPNGRFGADASSIVKASESFAYGEIASRANVSPAQAARQEPLGRPPSKSTHRDQPFDDILVGASAEGGKVELPRVDALRQVDDVLRFPCRELHARVLADSSASDAP